MRNKCEIAVNILSLVTICRGGAFQSWDQDRLVRMHFPTGVSHNAINGVAHFEKADLQVSINITFGGPTNVELRFWPDDNWLKGQAI